QQLSGRRAPELSQNVSGRVPRGSVGPRGTGSPRQAHRARVSRRTAEPSGQRLRRLVSWPVDAAALETLLRPEGPDDRAGADYENARGWRITRQTSGPC